MSYSLKSVTIRTDNSESGMAKINELWADIMTGKIPLDFIENGVPVKGCRLYRHTAITRATKKASTICRL